MSERLSPNLTRREGVATHPIRLADGEEWGIARPAVRLFPKVNTEVLDRLGREVECIAVDAGFGYPLEVERLVDRVRIACAEGSTQEQYAAFFTLASQLLVRAHELTLEDACELLSVSEDQLLRLVREVMSVVAEVDVPEKAKSVEVTTGE